MSEESVIGINSAGINELIENIDASKCEQEFIKQIKGIDSLKDLINDQQMDKKPEWDKSGFFTLLKVLDSYLLNGIQECSGRKYNNKTGYYRLKELETILKYFYVQRHVNAHDEDNKTEKIKENALQDFISDKYDRNVHFFEEILQNIDDAIGRKNKTDPDGADGEISIHWKGKEIEFCYPDRGFSFYDMMAITSLGNSIKKGDLDQASIGEKGIGFKSVFSVASKISIESRFFNFEIQYDKDRKTSVLQPSRITVPGSGEQCSILTITFDENFNIDGDEGFKAQLKDWLFENEKKKYLYYSPFLFLKNTRTINYKDEEIEKKIEIARSNIITEHNGFDGGTKGSYSVTTINDRKYLIYRSSLYFNKELIKNRWGDIDAIKDKSEDFKIDRPIEIAFPSIEKSAADIEGAKGLFYSFLPTEMIIDFPVYINVDVHLKSSRGRISQNDFAGGSKWNKHILDNISEAMKDAYLGITKLYDPSKTDELMRVVNNVAQKLYLYIREQKTEHYFSNKLNEFYKSIVGEAIYLNISDEFVKKENLFILWLTNGNKGKDEWNNFVSFCLNKPFPENQEGDRKQYPRDYDWQMFSAKGKYNLPNYRTECLKIYQGVKNFYENTEIKDNKKKNDILLDFLVGISTLGAEKKDDLRILFLDNDVCTNKYEICSRNEKKKDGKVVFIPPTEGNQFSDDISVFVSEKPFCYGEELKGDSDKDYNRYLKFLEGYIKKKDWVEYISNVLTKKKNIDNEEQLYECIKECIHYTEYINIEDIKKITVPSEIKEIIKTYIIPAYVWDKLEKKDYRIYRKAIANYVANETTDHFGYKLLDVAKIGGDQENIDKLEKLISFLIVLGVKGAPEIKVAENPIDALTIAIMPSYEGTTTKPSTLEFIYPGDGNYKYLGHDDDDDDEIKRLQQYLVEYVNQNYKKSLVEYVNQNSIAHVFVEKNIFKSEKIIFMPENIIGSGFYMYFQEVGERGGTSNKLCHQHKIGPFNEIAKNDAEYFIGKKLMGINDGNYKFASENKYPFFSAVKWEKETIYVGEGTYASESPNFDSDHSEIIKNIINSYEVDWLGRLRWIRIWNQVFSVYYSWKNPPSISPDDFVDCHKYLEIEDINNLLPNGYQINFDAGNRIGVQEETKEELQDYIKNEFGSEQSVVFENYYCYVSNSEKEEFVDLSKYNVQNNVENFNYLVAIKETDYPITEFVSAVLKNLLKLVVSDVQRKDIADIVDEIKSEKKQKLVRLEGEAGNYTEAIFSDEQNKKRYKDIIKNAKNQLPSPWKTRNTGTQKKDRSMKEWLCEPYEDEETGYRFQGYGYQCPICGSIAYHRSLSAMKYIKRIKNTDKDSMGNLPYFWLVGCLNCADMIERAEKVKLIDLDGGSLREALKHFKEVCYCYDNEHLFNHGKMKTMKLLFEINGNEYAEQIKISFLHMVLFLKLWKGEL